jgi:transposase
MSTALCPLRERQLGTINGMVIGDIFMLTPQWVGVDYGINTFTRMLAQTDPPSKLQALKAAGVFNPRAGQVHHPLFGPAEFFDPHDLPQLKYETLRAIEHDGYPIARAAKEFGLSRPTIYQAQAQFERQGLEGLLPRKRGPKNPHKLTPKVRQCLQELAASSPQLRPRELARQLRRRFRVNIHPRTIEKALKAKAKKGRQTTP